MTTNILSYEKIPGLQDAHSWASQEELELLKVLIDNGQVHLFENWSVGADENKKHSFFQQVRFLSLIQISFISALFMSLTLNLMRTTGQNLGFELSRRSLDVCEEFSSLTT